MNKTLTLGLLLCFVGAALVVAGCADHKPKPTPAPAQPVKPAPAVAAAASPVAPAPAAPVAPVTGANGMALPTGEKSSSAVWVEFSAPDTVLAGKPFTHTVTVTSLSGNKLTGVVLTERLPAGFSVTKTTPRAAVAGSHAKWTIGTLAPHASKTFTVVGTAAATGALKPCATVAFDIPEVCTRLVVVQPALKLVKTAPARVIVCDPITLKFVVTNTGTGHAQNVVIADTLPAGMKTLDGLTKVTFNAGTLAAGQAREFTTQVKVAKRGSYVNKATATGANGLSATSAPVTTVATLPVLVVTKSAPAKRFIGRPVTYNLTVTNKGDAEARNTVLVDTLPGGVTFQSASAGGSNSGGTVTWNLGTLAPGASKSVTLSGLATAKGVQTNVAKASAYCAAGTASAKTTIEGIPAILLECVDIDDPVEVGTNTTYVITVTNQGSAVGTNIVIAVTLPAQEKYVSSDGPTKAAVAGQNVTFAPLATLAPKARAVYKVVVKGIAEGDVRFKVSLTSDQMTQPAAETESTNIYK